MLNMNDTKKVVKRTEFAMWANEHALVSGVVILIGGIVGLFNFSGWQFSAYAVFIGCFITIYEYPRGLREDGVCIRRRGQDIIEPFVSDITKLCFNSYGVRAAVYFVLCLPCAGSLPPLTGGVSLLIASLLYFISAIRHETRKSPGVLPRKPKWKRKSTIREPKYPPPRLKYYNAAEGSNYPELKDRGDPIVKPNIISTSLYDGSENDDNHIHHIKSMTDDGAISPATKVEERYGTDIRLSNNNNVGFQNDGFVEESMDHERRLSHYLLVDSHI